MTNKHNTRTSVISAFEKNSWKVGSYGNQSKEFLLGATNVTLTSQIVCKLVKVKTRYFSVKRRDRRSRADLIESVIPCHDTYVVGSYRVSNPLRLTALAAMSDGYTTVLQHLLALPGLPKKDTDLVWSALRWI